MAVKDEFLFEKIGEMRNGYLEKLPAGGEEHIFPDGFEKKACGAKGISRIMLRRLAVAAVAAVLVFTAAAEGLPKERSFVSGGVAVSVTEYPKYIRMECEPADGGYDPVMNVPRIGYMPEGFEETGRDRMGGTSYVRLRNEERGRIAVFVTEVDEGMSFVIDTEGAEHGWEDDMLILEEDGQITVECFVGYHRISASGNVSEAELIAVAESIVMDKWRWE